MKNKCSSSFACDKRTLTFLLLLAFVLLVVLMPDLPRQEMPFAPYQTAKTYRKAKSTHENKNKSMFALYRIINKHEISKLIPSLHTNRSTLSVSMLFFFYFFLNFSLGGHHDNTYEQSLVCPPMEFALGPRKLHTSAAP